MKYLIFTDLDSTLLPKSKVIPIKTVKYLINLAKKGHIIVLCTGRPLTGALKYYQTLKENCILACDNGTRIVKPNDDTFIPISANFEMDELKEFLQKINSDIIMALSVGKQNIYGKNLTSAPLWMIHEINDTKKIESNLFFNIIDEPITLINLWIDETKNEHFLNIIKNYPNISYISFGKYDNHFNYELTYMNANKGFCCKKAIFNI